MKINCVIVDDEPENLKYLQQSVEDINDVEIIRSYTDGQSFLKGMAHISFDMCILDNRLPDTTGVELARRLKGKKVIFVSAHEVSAYDAFDVNAVDVLRKPVSKARLEIAVKKCRDKIINEKGYVYFRTQAYGKTRFKLDDIIYIEVNGEKKNIITSEGEEMIGERRSMDDLLNKLPRHRFCMVNRDVIINVNWLKAIKSRDEIVMNFKVEKEFKELTVGGKYMRTLKELLGSEVD